MINLYDTVRENIFFNKFISRDMLEEVMIGNIEINVSNAIVIDIHTKKQPQIEVPKYGSWGEDYNVVVIKLWGMLQGDFSLRNREIMTFQKLKINRINGGYSITQTNNDWEVSFQIVGDFLFREISAYIM